MGRAVDVGGARLLVLRGFTMVAVAMLIVAPVPAPKVGREGEGSPASVTSNVLSPLNPSLLPDDLRRPPLLEFEFGFGRLEVMCNAAGYCFFCNFRLPVPVPKAGVELDSIGEEGEREPAPALSEGEVLFGDGMV